MAPYTQLKTSTPRGRPGHSHIIIGNEGALCYITEVTSENL